MIIVELTNIFKGLDLIKCLKIMGESSLLCTGGGDKDHPPQKKKCKRTKWLSEMTLQITEKRREVKCESEK